MRLVGRGADDHSSIMQSRPLSLFSGVRWIGVFVLVLVPRPVSAKSPASPSLTHVIHCYTVQDLVSPVAISSFRCVVHNIVSLAVVATYTSSSVCATSLADLGWNAVACRHEKRYITKSQFDHLERHIVQARRHATPGPVQ